MVLGTVLPVDFVVNYLNTKGCKQMNSYIDPDDIAAFEMERLEKEWIAMVHMSHTAAAKLLELENKAKVDRIIAESQAIPPFTA